MRIGQNVVLNDKKAILFDLDGTLVDSVPDLAVALNQMLVTLGRETFEEEVIRGWVGNGAQMLVRRGLSGKVDPDDTLDEALLNEALSVFLKAYENNLCIDTKCYPKVLSTLEILKDRGYRMVVVTNKPFAFVAPLLEGLGMESFFEFSVGGDSLSVKKPDPMPLLHACERLGLDVDECVMIGDSKNDLLAANAARMQSIGVSYGYNYGEDIHVYRPDYVVDDFSEISQYLGKQA